MDLKPLVSLPTFVMTKVGLKLFAKRTHPWYGRTWTLREWYDGETEFCREFDKVGWIGMVTIVIMTIKVIFTIWMGH